MALALAAPALAAEGSLSHSGRVLIAVGGDVSLPAGERADAVIVVGGHATVASEANNVVVIDGTASITGTTIENLLVVRGSAEVVDTSVIYDIRTLDAQVEQVNVDVGGAVKGLDAELIGLGWIVGSALLLIWVGIGLATIVAGLLLAGLAARQVRTAGKLISHQPGMTAVVGLLALIVPPAVAVLAMSPSSASRSGSACSCSSGRPLRSSATWSPPSGSASACSRAAGHASRGGASVFRGRDRPADHLRARSRSAT